MNIVFLGSSPFAVACLTSLISSAHNILCVVTQQDKQKGRHLHLASTAVKKAAVDAHIDVFQPPSINTASSVNILKSYQADLFVVVAYGQILSSEVLTLPRIMPLNIHASLLPRYRGAAPINWAIINNEQQTGVTSMKMVRKMDAGPIILQERLVIEAHDTVVSLQERLACAGARVLLETIQRIASNNVTMVSQNEREVSFAPKLKKQDGLIDWIKKAQEIDCRVRGCWGWPGAFTYYKGKFLKIVRAQAMNLGKKECTGEPGEITRVEKDGIWVAAQEGFVVLQEVQLEGKRPMKVHEFIAGHRVAVGERLSKK
ncbi:MAG: methionyl-tRNA formyltransferase [Candidatus Omnitrophica bacterium]|nr:methionyl-tRNA formyltransferase [Candidatus Omnitrophota bacterium]